MDKDLYEFLKGKGLEKDTYEGWSARMSDPKNAQGLHNFVSAKKWETRDFPTWQAEVFGEKKKSEAGVSSPASGVVAKTVSPATPQTEQQATVVADPSKAGLTYFTSPDGRKFVKGKAGTVEIRDDLYKKTGDHEYSYIGPNYEGNPAGYSTETAEELASGKLLPSDDFDLGEEKQTSKGASPAPGGKPVGVSTQQVSTSESEAPTKQDEAALYMSHLSDRKYQDWRAGAVDRTKGNFMESLRNHYLPLNMKEASNTPQINAKYKEFEDGVRAIQSDQSKSQYERDVKSLRYAYKASMELGGVRNNSIWEDLSRAEREMRDRDPNGWDKMIQSEKEGQYGKLQMRGGQVGQTPGDLALTTGHRADKQLIYQQLEEGGVGMDDNSIAEAKLWNEASVADEKYNALKRRVESGAASPEDLSQAESAYERLLNDARKMKDQRKAGVLAQMESVQKVLDQSGGSIPPLTPMQRKAAEATLLNLKKQYNGFIDPRSQVIDTYAKNKQEIDAVAQQGDTPMDSMRRYLGNLIWEKKRLMQRTDMDESTLRGIMDEIGGLTVAGWNDDERRLSEVEAKIRSIAPVVLLNEHNPQGAKYQLGTLIQHTINSFSNTLLGESALGRTMSSPSDEEKAANVTEMMLAAGLDPQKDIQSPYQKRFMEDKEGPAWVSVEHLGDLAGMMAGMGAQMGASNAVLEGSGIMAPFKALDAAAKAAPSAKWLAKAMSSAMQTGVRYQATGMMFKEQSHFFNFMTGLGGGFGSSLTGSLLSGAAGKGVKDKVLDMYNRAMGSKASEATKYIVSLGASLPERIGAGMGSVAAQGIEGTFRGIQDIGGGSTIDGLARIWSDSDIAKGWHEAVKQQFGRDPGERLGFFADMFFLGMLHGGGGIGEAARERAEQLRRELPDEDRAVADQIVEAAAQLGDNLASQVHESEAESLAREKSGLEKVIGDRQATMEEKSQAWDRLDAVNGRLAELGKTPQQGSIDITEPKPQEPETVAENAAEPAEEPVAETTPAAGKEPETTADTVAEPSEEPAVSPVAVTPPPSFHELPEVKAAKEAVRDIDKVYRVNMSIPENKNKSKEDLTKEWAEGVKKSKEELLADPSTTGATRANAERELVKMDAILDGLKKLENPPEMTLDEELAELKRKRDDEIYAAIQTAGRIRKEDIDPIEAKYDALEVDAKKRHSEKAALSPAPGQNAETNKDLEEKALSDEGDAIVKEYEDAKAVIKGLSGDDMKAFGPEGAQQTLSLKLRSIADFLEKHLGWEIADMQFRGAERKLEITLKGGEKFDMPAGFMTGGMVGGIIPSFTPQDIARARANAKMAMYDAKVTDFKKRHGIEDIDTNDVATTNTPATSPAPETKGAAGKEKVVEPVVDVEKEAGDVPAAKPKAEKVSIDGLDLDLDLDEADLAELRGEPVVESPAPETKKQAVTPRPEPGTKQLPPEKKTEPAQKPLEVNTVSGTPEEIAAMEAKKKAAAGKPVIGDPIEFMQGPQGRQTKRSGKVIGTTSDGNYRVEFAVGGEKTSAVVKPENILEGSQNKGALFQIRNARKVPFDRRGMSFKQITDSAIDALEDSLRGMGMSVERVDKRHLRVNGTLDVRLNWDGVFWKQDKHNEMSTDQYGRKHEPQMRVSVFQKGASKADSVSLFDETYLYDKEGHFDSDYERGKNRSKAVETVYNRMVDQVSSEIESHLDSISSNGRMMGLDEAVSNVEDGLSSAGIEFKTSTARTGTKYLEVSLPNGDEVKVRIADHGKPSDYNPQGKWDGGRGEALAARDRRLAADYDIVVPASESEIRSVVDEIVVKSGKKSGLFQEGGSAIERVAAKVAEALNAKGALTRERFDAVMNQVAKRELPKDQLDAAWKQHGPRVESPAPKAEPPKPQTQTPKPEPPKQENKPQAPKPKSEKPTDAGKTKPKQDVDNPTKKQRSRLKTEVNRLREGLAKVWNMSSESAKRVSSVFEAVAKTMTNLGISKSPEEYLSGLHIGDGKDSAQSLKQITMPDGSKRTVREVGVEVVNGFYSPIEKKVGESKSEKQSARKWMELIGKGDEATWTGVRDWLEKKKPDEAVSRAEIMDFMVENRITIVEEVRQGDFKKWTLEGKRSGDKEIYIIAPWFVEGWNVPESHKTGNKAIDSRQLLRIRMNTRTDADRKKVLLVEEIQSDRGQEGKKEGFSEPGTKDSIDKALDSLLKARRDKADKALSLRTYFEENGRGKEGMQELAARDAKFKSMMDDVKKAEARRAEADAAYWAAEEKDKGPEAAPWVTDTNSWTKLGLKVAMKEAVRQGADKIAWTTGEQQNARYDLSKQVDRIDVEGVEDVDGLHFVDIHLPDGSVENLEVENGVVRDGQYKGQRLDNIIGKEYADKVLSTPSGETKRLEGEGLKLGGKGMKGFYGSPAEGKLGIVGEQMRALTKQEPGRTKLSGAGDVGEMRAELRNLEEAPREKTFAEFNARQQRIESLKKDIENSFAEVHSVDVTPEMRSQVEEGLPLFQSANAQFRVEQGKRIAEVLRKLSDGEAEAAALHEVVGHDTLYNIIDAASNGNRKAEKLMQTVLEEQGKGMTAEQAFAGNSEFAAGKEIPKDYRDMQEFFARSLERYLHEGPQGFSKKFQKVLEAVKDTMRRLYGQVVKGAIDVPLTDRMRSVFDTILGKDVTSAEGAKASGEKTGTQRLMEKYIGTASEALKNVVKDMPMFKSDYKRAEVFDKAVSDVVNALKGGTADSINSMVRELKNPSTDSNDISRNQFRRMALVKMFGAMADEAARLRDEATKGSPEVAKMHQRDADVFNTKMTDMLKAFSDEALAAGRGGDASSMWKVLGADMDVYALAVMGKANKAILDKAKASNGKPLGKAIETAVTNIKEKGREHADDIAESVSGDIDGVAEKSQASQKKKAAAQPKKTLADAVAALKALKGLQQRRMGLLQSGDMPTVEKIHGESAAENVAVVGVELARKGSGKYSDWVKSMKDTLDGIIDLDDAQLKEVFENAMVDGKTPRSHSEAKLEAAAKSPEKRAEREKTLREQIQKELKADNSQGDLKTRLKDKVGLTEEEADHVVKHGETVINSTAKKAAARPESFLPKPENPKTAEQKADARKRRELRENVQVAIRDHFRNPDGRPLLDKIMEQGLDKDAAQAVVDAVTKNAAEIMGQAVSGELDHVASNESRRMDRRYTPPKGRKGTTQTESLLKALVDGELNDQYMQGMLAHRYGMSAPPTAEQVAKIRKLGKAVASTGGSVQKKALLELGKAVNDIMPPNKLSEAADVFVGLVFSATLNSMATFGVNLSSVSDHYLLGALRPLGDPQQWGDLFRALRSKDQSALLLNPIAKIMVKAMAKGKPIAAGYRAFEAAFLSGVTSSRYDESINEHDIAKIVPILERNFKGKLVNFILKPSIFNPYSHIFGKTVQRILTATDAATTMMYGDLEFLDAMRMSAGKSGKSPSELKKMVGDYLAEKSSEWQEAYAQAESEANTVKDAYGKEMPLRLVQTRAREIARSKFAENAGLTDSELQEVLGAAQYNTMTLDRKGIFGQTADTINKMKNTNWGTRILLTPFAMFTKIPGNFGDALLDNTPIYGAIRNAGWSPTGMAQRLGWLESSAMIGEGPGSRLRRKQREGALFSMVLLGIAYAMLDNDDDAITTKGNTPEESYKIYGASWKNFASVAPSLLLASWLHDMKAEKKPMEDGVYGRLWALGTAFSTFYTEQSFVRGIRDFASTATSTFRLMSSEASSTQKGAGLVKNVLKPYINLGLRPLPTSQGLTRFTQDVIDPHKYSDDSMAEFLYYAMGLQHLTNERMVDRCGREIVSYPGDNVIPVKRIVEHFMSESNPDREIYKFLHKYRIMMPEMSNSMTKRDDPDGKYGFTVRQFSPDEWKAYTTKVGEIWAGKMREYIKDEPSLDVKVKGNRLVYEVQKDVLAKWSDALEKAKKEVFDGKKFPKILSEKNAQAKLDEALGQ